MDDIEKNWGCCYEASILSLGWYC